MSRALATNRQAASRRVMPREMRASLSFDGVDDYIEIPDASLPASAFQNGFSFGAWINPKSVGETNGRIFDKSTDDSGNDGFRFGLTSSNRWFLQINAGTVVGSSNLAIKYNNWQYVLTTVAANGTVTHYINGVRSGTPATTGALAGITTTNALRIGNRSGGTDRTFDGRIAEARIWNRPLTADEIRAIHFDRIVPTTGLVGEWKMNEGAGSTATDTSGNANHGTITGAIWSADTPTKARQLVGGNLVRNGDFSYVPPFVAATNVTSRWIDGTAGGSTSIENARLFNVYATGANQWSAQFDETVLYNGKPSIMLRTLATGSYASAFLSPQGPGNRQILIPVRPGRTYQLRGAYKTRYTSGDSNDGAFIALLPVRGDLSLRTTLNATTKVKTTISWTEYDYTYTPHADDRYVTIRLTHYGHTGAGTLIMDAWFANIRLTEVGGGRVVA